MGAVVSLSSDTETRPTPGMRAALAAAEVGDEQKGQDPTVTRLQERVADLLGKEAALWLPTGTMCNLVAVKTHTRPGDALVAEAMAHVIRAESGGAALASGVMVQGIHTERGVFTPAELEAAMDRVVAVPVPYGQPVGLVCVEQTHNFGGGAVWRREELAAVGASARSRGVPLHMDGARLMNACVASRVGAATFAAEVDSLWIDFTKGLGAPIGAVLAGSRDFIAAARRYKQLFGGAMRQAGVAAAGCLYALDHHVDRLAEDHEHARLLAHGLAAIDGIQVRNRVPETNMVFFDVSGLGLSNREFVDRLAAAGVRVSGAGGQIRAVTHLDVSRQGVERALAAIEENRRSRALLRSRSSAFGAPLCRGRLCIGIWASMLLCMVRRDDAGGRPSASRCSSPAGASPASVSAGAPSSRPQARPETAVARAGCQKPLRREQEVRGPQHEVKPAASTESQSESRAAHVTAKATSSAPRSGGARAGGLGGVWGAARGHGAGRNTRGPSARPESGQRVSHKPKVKAGAAQRESEGVVVLRRAAQHNAAGGKDPCGGHGVGARTREGMAGETGPNSPGRRTLLDQVRQLQRRLWAAAKRSPKRRFHALMDRIWRDDVLREAWRRVKRNRGSAGVDSATLAEIEQRGVDAFLAELGTALRAGTYRPHLVLRRYIPKADGRRRPLGIPTVRDRVAQMAATLVLSPIFEADFRDSSYGFRPKRSATQALETLRVRGARGGCHVLDADICDYFSSIDHEKLLTLVRQRVSDRRVLRLLRLWLSAGVMEAGQVQRTLAGTPQGGVISPLLSNIFLHVLDRVWEDRWAHLGTLVRYADDFVVMCDTKAAVDAARERVGLVLARLGLELHPEKTRVVDLSDGRAGFDFLGCHLRKRMSGPIWVRSRRRVYYLHRWPSRRAMKQVRARVRALTPRGRCHTDLRLVIADVNRVVRGWGQYFRTGNAAHHFVQLDQYVEERLRSLLLKRAGSRLAAGRAQAWRRPFFEALGLIRLRGTIRYPGVVHAAT